jgi:hypothetical protein
MPCLIVLPDEGSWGLAFGEQAWGCGSFPVDGVVAAPVAAAGELGGLWGSMIGLRWMGRPWSQPGTQPMAVT